MLRSIWNGAIAFGMVSIPVKLYTATAPKDVSFHLLHRTCNTRIKEVRWCPTDERAVSPDELVRGYEYAKDKYVAVTDNDLAHLPVPSKHVIALSAFVEAAQIDPVYYQKCYYLEPGELGLKAYALLVRALKERGLTALATITLRSRERLCALRPLHDTLILDALFYADEIRVPVGGALPKVAISDRELAMAFSFIDLLSEAFQPDKYEDTYRMALQKLVAAKLEGRAAAEEEVGPAPRVVDLMSALKASVEAAKKSRPLEKEAEHRERRRRAS